MTINYPENDKIMKISEVAEMLRISRSKIYTLVTTNQIPHIRIGHSVRIRYSELTRWLEDNSNRPSGMLDLVNDKINL